MIGWWKFNFKTKVVQAASVKKNISKPTNFFLKQASNLRLSFNEDKTQGVLVSQSRAMPKVGAQCQ